MRLKDAVEHGDLLRFGDQQRQLRRLPYPPVCQGRQKLPDGKLQALEMKLELPWKGLVLRLGDLGFLNLLDVFKWHLVLRL